MATQETNETIQGDDDLLYHVKRVIINSNPEPSGAVPTVDITGTYTSLPVAKAAARSALVEEGYAKEFFPVYLENDGTEDFSNAHGDGVVVFAKATNGDTFVVGLDTTENVDHLKGDSNGKVEEVLHYVLQTRLEYGSSKISTQVEGVYLLRRDAYDAAYSLLIDVDGDISKESYAEYDEYDKRSGDWPYGDGVLVHAVGQTGENFWVSVKEVLRKG